jgi:hypothetical protein
MRLVVFFIRVASAWQIFWYRRRLSWMRCQKGATIMKMISAALIVLALFSMAAPVNAFDAKSFFDQQAREGGGGGH